MILVDANLLIYAHVRDMPAHAVAKNWLEEQLNGRQRVGLPWPTLLAFLRLVTNPRVFERAQSVARAWKQVQEWLAHDVVWVPGPGEQHQAILATLLPRTEGTPKLIPDAHLAALAMEHGLELMSADGDFARFPGLRWKNPIAT